MNKTFGYYVLMVITWPMQFFPLRLHYVWSDLFYVILYHLVGYRKEVVALNLKNSFPEKTESERKEIARKFYHNFADMFIETLYFAHASEKKTNRSFINAILNRSRTRYGKLRINLFNRQLGIQLFRDKLKAKRYYVYKHLESKTFDQYYKKLRSRGAEPLEMAETYRKLYSCVKSGQQYLALFISDQRPLAKELYYWVTFMNQDTPVYTGTEKIARNTNAAVVYTEITRIARGHCRLKLELLKEDIGVPKGYEITDMFMARLEESIRQYPDQYFWTHKRWKYSRTSK